MIGNEGNEGQTLLLSEYRFGSVGVLNCLWGPGNMGEIGVPRRVVLLPLS